MDYMQCSRRHGRIMINSSLPCHAERHGDHDAWTLLTSPYHHMLCLYPMHTSKLFFPSLHARVGLSLSILSDELFLIFIQDLPCMARFEQPSLRACSTSR